MWKRHAAIILGSALLAAWAAPGWSASIGRVQLIKEWAYERLMPGEWDDLFIQDDVFLNQRIRTPANAAVHVHFVDGAKFRIGSNSEVLIDKYVYDPGSPSGGEFVTTLGKGVFRFISGKVKNYTIKTPTATVGIRGTDIVVAVLDDESTVMQVNSGRANMVACSTGPAQRFECRPGSLTEVVVGETAGVAAGSLNVEKGVDVPDDPGLTDDAGLAALNPQGGGPSRFNSSFGDGFNELCDFTDPLCNTINTIQSPATTSPFDQVNEQ